MARLEFPEQVVELEESWGDWLFNEGKFDSAISHFLGMFFIKNF